MNNEDTVPTTMRDLLLRLPDNVLYSISSFVDGNDERYPTLTPLRSTLGKDFGGVWYDAPETCIKLQYINKKRTVRDGLLSRIEIDHHSAVVEIDILRDFKGELNDSIPEIEIRVFHVDSRQWWEYQAPYYGTEVDPITPKRVCDDEDGLCWKAADDTVFTQNGTILYDPNEFHWSTDSQCDLFDDDESTA